MAKYPTIIPSAGKPVAGPSPIGLITPRDGPYVEPRDDNGSGGVDADGITNLETTKLYNTVSCPCSSAAVTLANGKIICERENFGKKQYIHPISINNHFISSKPPKVNNKWRCTKVRCEQDDFKWDTLYVVKVEESPSNKRPINNFITSTSNCYIPPSTLKDYAGEIVDTKTDNSIEFNESLGVTNYTSTRNLKKENLIRNVFFNNRDILSEAASSGFKTLHDSKSRKGISIKSIGETVSIRVVGSNEAMFTMTLEDSSGCTILEKRLRNESITKGVFQISQKFPPLPSGATSETYTLKLSISADTRYYFYGELYSAGTVDVRIEQFANPTYTYKQTATLTSATIAQTNVTLTGASGSQRSLTKTHTTTVAQDDTDDLYYISKKLRLGDVVTHDNIIKKTLVKEEDTKEISSSLDVYVIDKNIPDPSDATKLLNSGDLQVGMELYGSVEKTRVVRKSIDLDIHKEPCEDCDKHVDIKTNKFEIDHTDGIFPGMVVKGVDFETALVSIDSNVCIMLATEQVISKGDTITFSHDQRALIESITAQSGKQLLTMDKSVRLPNGTELQFESGYKSIINGTISYNKSGTSAMTLTTTINNAVFGRKDTIFTLNTGDFLTITPNACDQYITIGKNSTYDINFIKCDTDSNRYDKIVSIVTGTPKHGVTSATSSAGTTLSSYSKSYTPNPNFKGKDKITFTVNDRENTSEEKTIYITVK